jgi:hypothetical protein
MLHQRMAGLGLTFEANTKQIRGVSYRYRATGPGLVKLFRTLKEADVWARAETKRRWEELRGSN